MFKLLDLSDKSKIYLRMPQLKFIHYIHHDSLFEVYLNAYQSGKNQGCYIPVIMNDRVNGKKYDKWGHRRIDE